MELSQPVTERPGGDVGVAGDAVAAMSAALDWLTSGELWRLSDVQLAALARMLHVAESRVGAASVAVLSEAVGRGLPVGSGALSGAAWLRAQVPVTPGQAKARAFLVEVLPSPELAPTQAALAAGAISPGQAAVVARTMAGLDALPVAVDEQTRADAQQVLLRFADRLDPAQLGQAGARVRYNLDPQAGERLARDEDAQAEAQEAYLVQDVATGMWHGRLILAPTEGAMLRAALDPLAAPEPATDGTRDARPARRRLAEAFSRLAQRCLLGGPGSLSRLPARQGSPIRVAITADLATAIAAYDQPGLAAGELDTGQPGGWLVSPLTVADHALRRRARPGPGRRERPGAGCGPDPVCVPAPDPHSDRAPRPALHLPRLHPPGGVVPDPPPDSLQPWRGHVRGQRGSALRTTSSLRPRPWLGRSDHRRSGHLATPRS
jgi:Domain of unknown function (DUF222)